MRTQSHMLSRLRRRVGIALIGILAASAALVLSGSAPAQGLSDPVPAPVPAPYPGDVGAVPPALPSAPSSETVLAAACTPYVDGDYAHRSKSAPYRVSAHGCWYRNKCPYTKTMVYIGLQEYYSDGVWRTKETGSKYVYPGGGSGNRATAQRYCENTLLAGWGSYIIVYIGNGASAYTDARNLYCQVFS